MGQCCVSEQYNAFDERIAGADDRSRPLHATSAAGSPPHALASGDKPFADSGGTGSGAQLIAMTGIRVDTSANAGNGGGRNTPDGGISGGFIPDSPSPASPLSPGYGPDGLPQLPPLFSLQSSNPIRAPSSADRLRPHAVATAAPAHAPSGSSSLGSSSSLLALRRRSIDDSQHQSLSCDITVYSEQPVYLPLFGVRIFPKLYFSSSLDLAVSEVDPYATSASPATGAGGGGGVAGDPAYPVAEKELDLALDDLVHANPSGALAIGAGLGAVVGGGGDANSPLNPSSGAGAGPSGLDAGYVIRLKHNVPPRNWKSGSITTLSLDNSAGTDQTNSSNEFDKTGRWRDVTFTLLTQLPVAGVDVPVRVRVTRDSLRDRATHLMPVTPVDVLTPFTVDPRAPFARFALAAASAHGDTAAMLWIVRATTHTIVLRAGGRAGAWIGEHTSRFRPVDPFRPPLAEAGSPSPPSADASSTHEVQLRVPSHPFQTKKFGDLIIHKHSLRLPHARRRPHHHHSHHHQRVEQPLPPGPTGLAAGANGERRNSNAGAADIEVVKFDSEYENELKSALHASAKSPSDGRASPNAPVVTKRAPKVTAGVAAYFNTRSMTSTGGSAGNSGDVSGASSSANSSNASSNNTSSSENSSDDDTANPSPFAYAPAPGSRAAANNSRPAFEVGVGLMVPPASSSASASTARTTLSIEFINRITTDVLFDLFNPSHAAPSHAVSGEYMPRELCAIICEYVGRNTITPQLNRNFVLAINEIAVFDKPHHLRLEVDDNTHGDLTLCMTDTQPPPPPPIHQTQQHAIAIAPAAAARHRDYLYYSVANQTTRQPFVTADGREYVVEFQHSNHNVNQHAALPSWAQYSADAGGDDTPPPATATKLGRSQSGTSLAAAPANSSGGGAAAPATSVVPRQVHLLRYPTYTLSVVALRYPTIAFGSRVRVSVWDTEPKTTRAPPPPPHVVPSSSVLLRPWILVKIVSCWPLNIARPTIKFRVRVGPVVYTVECGGPHQPPPPSTATAVVVVPVPAATALRSPTRQIDSKSDSVMAAASVRLLHPSAATATHTGDTKHDTSASTQTGLLSPSGASSLSSDDSQFAPPIRIGDTPYALTVWRYVNETEPESGGGDSSRPHQFVELSISEFAV